MSNCDNPALSAVWKVIYNSHVVLLVIKWTGVYNNNTLWTDQYPTHYWNSNSRVYYWNLPVVL